MKKMQFRLQDVPQHEIRVYFSGENTLSSPWQITESTSLNVFPILKPPVLALNSALNRLFRDINTTAKYSKGIEFMSYFVKIYYYPLWLMICEKIRKQKAVSVQNTVNNMNYTIKKNGENDVQVKLHIDPYLSIGCLEIFNKSKEFLNFYIKDYFPLYFKLHKMDLGGYCLDFTDPILKALISQIEQKNEKKTFQNYLTELNTLFRNSDNVLPILNKLWEASDQEPGLQAYLWQPPSNVLGIDSPSIDLKLPLFLLFSSQNPSPNPHFISQNTFPNVFFDQINSLKHRYNIRNEYEAQDKRTMLWQIENTMNQKVISWCLGVASILMLIASFIIFFVIIVVCTDYPKFTLGKALYFVIAPCCQFFTIFYHFKLILQKSQSSMPCAVFFTLSTLIKTLIMMIYCIVQILSDQTFLLLLVLFYIWIFMVLLAILQLVAICLLNAHYCKHK